MSMTQLIREYTTTTKAAAAQLQSELGVQNLLQAWMDREIAQRGELSDGSVYQFHGIGCSIERSDGVDLDFDFGPGGRADGFDAWRLWRFAKQFPMRYRDLQEREKVDNDLQALVDQGVVRSSDVDGDRLLYVI